MQFGVKMKSLTIGPSKKKKKVHNSIPPKCAVLGLSHHIPPSYLPKNEVQICQRGLNIRDSDNPSPENTCRRLRFQVLLFTPLA